MVGEIKSKESLKLLEYNIKNKQSKSTLQGAFLMQKYMLHSHKGIGADC